MKNLKSTLTKLAKTLSAVEFIMAMEKKYPAISWMFDDADNLFDYNYGNFNIHIHDCDLQLWFYNGVLENVDGMEL